MGAALSFLTVFGRSRSPHPGALAYFPIVGALIGLAVGYLWWGASLVTTPLLAAAVAVIGDAVVTGLLHLDGLADSGDGLIAPMDREARLAAMRDHAIGAFGMITVALVLLVRTAAIASIAASVTAPLLVAALWCTSRGAMAVVTVSVPYARPLGGLASLFLDRNAKSRSLVAAPISLVLAAGLALWHGGPMALIPVAAAIGAGVAVTQFARRRIGGFTGDTLGATGVIAETVGLIVWAAL